MHFCFRKRVHHKMERPPVDGGCGAVYPHGALHAPVRAPDGELEDGAEGKRGRCSSSSTVVSPLAPRRAVVILCIHAIRRVASPRGEGGREGGREGEPCTMIPSRYLPLDTSKIMETRPFSVFFLSFFSFHVDPFRKERGYFL